MRKRRGIQQRICVVVLLCGILCLFSFVSGTESFADEKTATSEKPPPSTYTDPVTGMEFVYIPGGEFMMGSERYDDTKPVHKVKLDGFYMGKYEVTVGEFRRFTKETGYKDKVYEGGFCDNSVQATAETEWENPYIHTGKMYPVTCLSWNGATAFVEWLRKKTGMNFHLPTEAQWEYAARAGSTAEAPWGDDSTQACLYGNISNASNHEEALDDEYLNCYDPYRGTAPVGSFLPNAFGLYDMIGNVSEYTLDYYAFDYYAHSPIKNPYGPSIGKEMYDSPEDYYPVESLSRIVRGGSYYSRPSDITFTSRISVEDDFGVLTFGFRIVLKQ